MTELAPHENGTAVQRATAAIRAMILDGRIVPGQALRQESMAKAVGMSRAPIREALFALLSEGLVQYTPNVGYTVNRLSYSELTQIYEMRERLEGLLLESITGVPNELCPRLRDYNTEMTGAIRAGDHVRFNDLNQSFHFEILDLPGKNLVAKEVRRLWDISRPYRVVYVAEQGPAARVLAEHEEIIRSLERNDLAKVVEISTAHRRAAAAHVSALLANRR